MLCILIEGYLLFCALIYTSPYYDCPPEYDGVQDGTGSIWTIHYYDDYTTKWCEMLGLRVYTCANVDLDHINFFLPLKNIVDDFGMTALEHELEHLKCDCNFHSINEP